VRFAGYVCTGVAWVYECVGLVRWVQVMSEVLHMVVEGGQVSRRLEQVRQRVAFWCVGGVSFVVHM